MTTLHIPTTFTRVSSLGRPLKVYGTSLGQKMTSLMSAGMFLLFSFAILVILRPMMLNGRGPFQGMNAAGMDSYLSLITLGISALFTLLAVFHLVKLALAWNKAIVVYEQGLAFRQRGRLHECRWEEVANIQAQVVHYSYYGVVSAGTLRNYWLSNNKGQVLPLTQAISRVQELVNDVRNAVLPLMLGRSLTDYQAGRPVAFGPIQVHQQGIAVSGKVYQWSEVESVAVNDGRVQVSKRGGGWFSGASVDVAQVPNLEVLIALLAEIKRKMAV
jgi:hypothetical protein